MLALCHAGETHEAASLRCHAASMLRSSQQLALPPVPSSLCSRQCWQQPDANVLVLRHEACDRQPSSSHAHIARNCISHSMARLKVICHQCSRVYFFVDVDLDSVLYIIFISLQTMYKLDAIDVT